MKTITTQHKVAGLAGVLAAGALGLAGATAGMAPAQAAASDTDRPRITERHFDFGKNWTVSGPRNGGYLYWSLSSGVTTAEVEGYLYLTDHECGRLRVVFYDDDHDYLAERSSAVECAPGNGKTQWWKSVSYSSTLVSHAHVTVQRQNSNGSFTEMGSVAEDFD